MYTLIYFNEYFDLQSYYNTQSSKCCGCFTIQPDQVVLALVSMSAGDSMVGVTDILVGCTYGGPGPSCGSPAVHWLLTDMGFN